MSGRKEEDEMIAEPSEKSRHTSSISHKWHNDTQHDYLIPKPDFLMEDFSIQAMMNNKRLPSGHYKWGAC